MWTIYGWGLFFKNHLCLLIGVFRPLTFNVMIDIIRLISTISVTWVFIAFLLCFSVSPSPSASSML